MFNPSFDRTEWRSRDTSQLIAAAKESGHELAIALGERLDDLDNVDDRLADLTEDHNDLQERFRQLRDDYEALNAAYDELDDQHVELQSALLRAGIAGDND